MARNNFLLIRLRSTTGSPLDLHISAPPEVEIEETDVDLRSPDHPDWYFRLRPDGTGIQVYIPIGEEDKVQVLPIIKHVLWIIL